MAGKRPAQQYAQQSVKNKVCASVRPMGTWISEPNKNSGQNGHRHKPVVVQFFEAPVRSGGGVGVARGKHGRGKNTFGNMHGQSFVWSEG